MSQIVIHDAKVFLAGQVAADFSHDVQAQTRSVLDKIDALLSEAGTDNAHILSALIHLNDMRHFELMNEMWDAWVPDGHAPVRTCVGAPMARRDILVEITIVAALPE